MLHQISTFLTGEPDPEDSRLVRVGMFVGGLLAIVCGIVAAVQLHWASLILFAFGGVVLFAWWVTVHRISRPIRLTAAAAEVFAQSMADSGEGAWLRIGLTDGQYNVEFVQAADRSNHLRYQDQGIAIAIPRECVKALTGVEIDFVRVGSHQGFKFSRA